MSHAQTIQERDGVAVVVYTTTPCFGCGKTKEKLDENDIEYTAVDVKADEGAFNYVTEELNFRRMPVVVVNTPDGEVIWSGLQPQMIKKHITHRAES